MSLDWARMSTPCVVKTIALVTNMELKTGGKMNSTSLGGLAVVNRFSQIKK